MIYENESNYSTLCDIFLIEQVTKCSLPLIKVHHYACYHKFIDLNDIFQALSYAASNPRRRKDSG